MRMPKVSCALVAILFATAACKTEEKSAAPTSAPVAAPAAQATPGIDIDKKIVRIGALNDESGPGAGIGKPYANGKRTPGQGRRRA